MKIRTQEGRMFQGTPVQIVRAMQDIAFGAADFTLSQYIDWVISNVQRFEGPELHVQGDTDEQRAASLVEEMLRTGLSDRIV
jgi:hypothetical protein